MNVNECNVFYTEEKNHWRFDCTIYCNNFTVVIEGCIREMEINMHGERRRVWQKRRNVTF
jgi:hypothetical protein